ncbi:hypothetical protein GC175_20745 [bacterium]|nr:hypothetical protein [bacterium]
MNDGSVDNSSAHEEWPHTGLSNAGQSAEHSQSPQLIKVEIYVADHCHVCDYTYEVAASIQRDFPEVALEIIDMAAPQRPIPEVVFATPTYLLNGHVWSLGNPSPEDVHTRLSEALTQTTSLLPENRNE